MSLQTLAALATLPPRGPEPHLGDEEEDPTLAPVHWVERTNVCSLPPPAPPPPHNCPAPVKHVLPRPGTGRLTPGHTAVPSIDIAAVPLARFWESLRVGSYPVPRYPPTCRGSVGGGSAAGWRGERIG